MTENFRSALHRAALLVGSVLLVLLTGCGQDTEVVSEGDYLVFDRVAIGQTGSLLEPAEWVVRDSVSWAEASRSLTPLAPFGRVDFSQSVVVVVAAPTESAGYHMEVESVEELSDEVVISYVFHRPATDCMPLMGEALPFQVVKVRRFEQENVRFERRTQRYECTWKQ